jgi:hypothetical protein
LSFLEALGELPLLTFIEPEFRFFIGDVFPSEPADGNTMTKSDEFRYKVSSCYRIKRRPTASLTLHLAPSAKLSSVCMFLTTAARRAASCLSALLISASRL